jgi:AcrR family transcriptional regulator
VSTEKRTYRLQARAERQRETRGRIVEATVALHREVGPARTTISDIARRSGVERLTVYNHFGRLEDLLAACQADFLSASPTPAMIPVAGGGDPLDRFEAMLVRLYGWFRSNQAMERNVHRDRRLVRELDGLLREHSDPHFDAAAGAWARLVAGRGRVDGARAMVRLALDFQTWDMLASQGLGNRRIAELWRASVGAVARTPRVSAGSV